MKKMKFVNGLAIAFLGLSVIAVSCKKEGCTDPLASNYDKRANHDDGSCLYDGTTPGTTTNVTENITTPTTWSAATINVCGDIEVSAALTINPGVNVVMCAGASIEVRETGSINAVGTAANPISFKGEVATPGYWEGMKIESNNPNNRFEYVTVSDAGTYWAWGYANVYLSGTGRLVLKNSTISNSDKVGLYAKSGTTLSEFSGNTFASNGTVGLSLEAQHVGSLDEASNYNAGNGEAYIHVREGSINTEQTWKRTTTPLLIISTIDIYSGLTIEAGSTVLFESGEGFDVRESGWLTAVGTAGQPINFNGRFNTPGYWAGIKIGSNNPNNKLTYTSITDGGSYWAWGYANVYLSGRVEMNNSTISNSNSWGAYIKSSSVIMCGGIAQTDAAGVMLHNTISGNGLGADADCAGGGCTVYFE